VCVFVCLSVCFSFLMHGRSFERIGTKFLHVASLHLQMVMGVSERRSSPLPRAPGNLKLVDGRRNGSSAVGARCD